MQTWLALREVTGEELAAIAKRARVSQRRLAEIEATDVADVKEARRLRAVYTEALSEDERRAVLARMQNG